MSSSNQDGAQKKYVFDPNESVLYQAISERVDEIKNLLEEKRQQSLLALKDYTGNIVEQVQSQLVNILPSSSGDNSEPDPKFSTENQENQQEEEQEEEIDAEKVEIRFGSINNLYTID